MIQFGGSGGGGMGLKKGPWTAAEDEILAAYVREHGEGNWNAVQKNTRLARCGKSCRLRWANHLRPNLKKGTFSPDEERLIINLHAQLGNKWARMAAQLPGRTDNEIKNFWNTRQKRLQRQGLPLYPPDIVPTYQTRQPQQHHDHHHHNHHFLQEHQQQQQQQQQQQIYLHTSSQATTTCSPHPSPTIRNMATASSPSSFTFQTTQLYPHSPTPCPSPTTPQPPPPLSPHQYPTLPLFNNIPKSPTTTTTTSAVNNGNAFGFSRPTPLLKQPSFRFKRFNNDHSNNDIPSSSASFNISGNCVSMPFSPLAKSSYTPVSLMPYSSPATPTGATSYNVNQRNHLVSSTSSSHLPSFSSNSSSLVPASSPNPLQTHFTSSSVQSPDFVQSAKLQLPSSQNFQSNTMVFDTNNFTNNENQNQIQNQENLDMDKSNTGLLEDMLEEAEALAGGQGQKRRRVLSLSEENNDNNPMLNDFGHSGASNDINSSSALNQNEEKLNQMQDNLEKLLDVIPCTMDALDWGSDGKEISNGQSSGVADDNLMLDVQQLTSFFPDNPGNDEHHKNPTSCSWDKLPGLC